MATPVDKKLNRKRPLPALLAMHRGDGRHPHILALGLGLLILAGVNPVFFDLIVSTLADVYLGVSVFVALTLGVFYTLDRRYQGKLAEVLAQRRLLEVPVASLLGALPGCGGAIIVVTQYVNGLTSFGALVAVLISTMGDAAFLLLAREPQTALLVYAVSLFSGVIFGYLVNAAHPRIERRRNADAARRPAPPPAALPEFAKSAFLALLAPGAVLGLTRALQWDIEPFFGPLAAFEPVKWLGFAGAFVALAVWLSQPLDSWTARFKDCTRSRRCVREMVVAETSFVSVWVALGFLSFEMLVHFTTLDLRSMFQGLGALSVILATLIGFIPGCGPQIIITTLYLNGVIPLSAQLANAISNDGDALFPALALTPRAALYATLYSAIPALLVGYIAYWME